MSECRWEQNSLIDAPKPTAPITKPTKDIHFWPLIFPRLVCQNPMNHAAGMEISVEPNE